MCNVKIFHVEMVNEALGVIEIIEGEDMRKKAESIHQSLLMQTNTMPSRFLSISSTTLNPRLRVNT